MIKLIFCATRKSDVALTDFRKQWADRHIPMLDRFAEASGAVRTVHSETLAVERNLQLMLERGTRQPYDAVSEVWWNNAAELQQAVSDEQVAGLREQLFRTDAEFIDHENSTLFYTQELT